MKSTARCGFMPAAAAVFVALFAVGCAGGRIYYCGINHAYLCAVRVVRVNGYVIRTQEFKPYRGTLVAARSIPDPAATVITRSLVERASEIVGNTLEHRKLEMGKGTASRVRTEDRIIVDFKATGGGLGWLDWGAKNRTMVKMAADVTQYGKNDWIIRRKKREKEFRKSFHLMMDECLRGGAVAEVLPAAVPEKPAAAVLKPEAGAGQAAAPASRPPEAARPGPSKPAFDPALVLEKARKDYEQGAYGAAAEGLEKVLSVEAQNAEALGYLGAAYYQMGRLEDSVAMYERYLAIVPADGETREFLEGLKGSIAETGK